MISQYWVGQIPNKPLSIQVKNNDGSDADLTIYSSIAVKMLGSYNEEIDLTGSTINTNNSLNGQVVFVWPTNKTLFENSGDYILQLQLTGTGKKDFTSTHIIKVRELGEV